MPSLAELIHTTPGLAKGAVSAVIAAAPTKPTDDLTVVIPSFDGGRVEWGPCPWIPSNAYPKKGDPCLVIFDENETPWVAVLAASTRSALYTELWTWANKTTDANGVGQVGLNAATWAASTVVNINKQTTGNRDVTRWLDLLLPGDLLDLQQKTDASRWGRYLLTATPTDQGSWRTIPVKFVVGAGAPPAANADASVTWLTTMPLP